MKADYVFDFFEILIFQRNFVQKCSFLEMIDPNLFSMWSSINSYPNNEVFIRGYHWKKIGYHFFAHSGPQRFWVIPIVWLYTLGWISIIKIMFSFLGKGKKIKKDSDNYRFWLRHPPLKSDNQFFEYFLKKVYFF